MFFRIIFDTKKYYVRGYENLITNFNKDDNKKIFTFKIKMILFFNKIIFTVKKFLLNLVLDDYSKILIKEYLTNTLPYIYEKQKDFKYKTPTMSITEEDIKDINYKFNKDEIYIKTLLNEYL